MSAFRAALSVARRVAKPPPIAKREAPRGSPSNLRTASLGSLMTSGGFVDLAALAKSRLYTLWRPIREGAT
jgi:hypothetical protein